jgi:hypothetical protein
MASTLAYVGVADRKTFDEIGATCQDAGENEKGHVLVKQIGDHGKDEVTVIFHTGAGQLSFPFRLSIGGQRIEYPRLDPVLGGRSHDIPAPHVSSRRSGRGGVSYHRPLARPVHAGGFFFSDCCGRRAVDGVAFVPTFFGAFAAAGRVKREAIAARSAFEHEEEYCSLAEAPVPDRPNFIATRAHGLRFLVHAEVLHPDDERWRR